MAIITVFGMAALVSFWSGNEWYVLPLIVLTVPAGLVLMASCVGILNVELFEGGSIQLSTYERWELYTLFSVSLIIVTLIFMYFAGSPELVYEPRTFMLQ